jgi:SAM-dependent methyltransferase
LRPSAQDVAVYQAVINRWARTHGTPRALILGVTPELYRLDWPRGADVAALDHTSGMIDAVWPGPRSAVICGEWTEMPLQPGSRDLALCDGGLHLLAHPHDQARLVQNVWRLLPPAGLCILRLFVRPRPPERPDAVLGDLLAGRVDNPHLLKLRLGLALQEDSERGVQLAQVWQAFHQAAPVPARLASRLGWPLESLLTINTYRDSPIRYHFLDLAAVQRLFCREPGGFSLQLVQEPVGDWGELTPIVVFRRDGAAAGRGR